MLQFGGWRRVIGLDAVVARPALSVSPGDRFFEHGNWDMVWVVERLLEPRGTSLPHVVISHARYRTEKRLVSLSTLLDSDRFERDYREPHPVQGGLNRRRRHDAPRSTLSAPAD